MPTTQMRRLRRRRLLKNDPLVAAAHCSVGPHRILGYGSCVVVIIIITRGQWQPSRSVLPCVPSTMCRAGWSSIRSVACKSPHHSSCRTTAIAWALFHGNFWVFGSTLKCKEYHGHLQPDEVQEPCSIKKYDAVRSYSLSSYDGTGTRLTLAIASSLSSF